MMRSMELTFRSQRPALKVIMGEIDMICEALVAALRVATFKEDAGEFLHRCISGEL